MKWIRSFHFPFSALSHNLMACKLAFFAFSRKKTRALKSELSLLIFFFFKSARELLTIIINDILPMSKYSTSLLSSERDSRMGNEITSTENEMMRRKVLRLKVCSIWKFALITLSLVFLCRLYICFVSAGIWNVRCFVSFCCKFFALVFIMKIIQRRAHTKTKLCDEWKIAWANYKLIWNGTFINNKRCRCFRIS